MNFKTVLPEGVVLISEVDIAWPTSDMVFAVSMVVESSMLVFILRFKVGEGEGLSRVLIC
jgi:hypothetical protein